ncbi:MAG: fluoride efflux transporter FluC [Gammaproteobacteria bacterium]
MSLQPVPPRWAIYMLVGLGSALGGVARWLLSDLLQAEPGLGFPWGTLWVNTSGSFLIGAYAGLVAPGGRWSAGLGQRLFFMTGFCGGYTTFSMFSLETLHYVGAGLPGLAAWLAGVSLAAWLFAVWSGYALAERFSRRTRP